MSIVNLKMIFVKQQKQTRKRPTQGRGAKFIYNRNGRSHTRGIIRVRRVIRRLTLSVNFDELWRWIIRFRYPVYSRSLPSEKIGEGVSVGEGVTVHRLV